MARRKASPKRFQPVGVSPETRALVRFFPEGRGKFVGWIDSELFGLNVPEAREDGNIECKWIMGGLYCDLTTDENIYAGDKKVYRILTRYTLGWDSEAREYRMFGVENVGVMHRFEGRLKGNKLVFLDETMIKGKLTRVRYTFVRKGLKTVVWIVHMSVKGGPWKLTAESVVTYS
jgi:hypothetical protein